MFFSMMWASVMKPVIIESKAFIADFREGYEGWELIMLCAIVSVHEQKYE